MQINAKILIVEDNDFVRMQIVRFLSEEKYQIMEAPDGLKALEQVDDTVAMAIVDVRMEPIDGFEFVKAIRARNMDTPVILVTGDQNPDLLNESAKWGIAAVLMKPVQKDRLLKTVSRTLQNRARSS